MVMKVRDAKSYLVHGQDVELVYQAVLQYVDALEKYKSWIQESDKPSKSLAVQNVQEEIFAYRELQLDVYEKCFTGFAPSVERVSRKERGDQ